MPIVTLPDGSQRQFTHEVSILDIANDIGSKLARDTIAGKVNHKLVDANTIIKEDSLVTIITKDSPEGLEIIRHSTAHLLAQAVKELYTNAQVTIGPVIDDGFYYDFAFERPFTPDDMAKIEAKMLEIKQRDAKVRREVLAFDQAIQYFESIGEHYKVEIIKDLPKDEPISVYWQGDFCDLCRGPHVPNLGRLGVFKLTKLAGAYWRGNSDNEMLQRIYGTAWATQKSLDSYLHQLAEAEKRDHRKLGKQLDLFHFQEEAPGMVFWHDKGYTLYKLLQDYIRSKLQSYNYNEIRTPQIVDRRLWESSGHWDKYQNEMFITESETHLFAVKPMSCPCHVQIFKQGLKSYRDLPLRMAEFGLCHRNEFSGTLHGLILVRGFTQDDAHIFCTEAQIETEIQQLIKLVYEIYNDFGFSDVICRLSTRPDKRVGSDETWDKSEQALEAVLNATGLPWELCPGDGAFYGPKIDFTLRDCLGRLWQCGTIQLDFLMPGRLEAYYIAEDSTKHIPVMIHRAILGSLERFMGILIEHYEAKFPLWIAPLQSVILNITDSQADYAIEISKKLSELGFRVKTDLRNEKIGFKIREHTLQRVPYLIIIGEREAHTQTISVRTQSGKDLGSMTVEELCHRMSQQVQDKA